MRPQYLFLATLSSASLAALLAGCSTVSNLKVWPFDNGSQTSTAARGPANATEYQCEGGKRFYVRTLDNGNAVWLIYPDREVSLGKSGTRYTNGVAVFEISGGEATLVDGTVKYSGCKTPAKKP